VFSLLLTRSIDGDFPSALVLPFARVQAAVCT